MEKLTAEISNEYDGNYKEMKQPNEPILQSVGLQLQGMNRTIEKWKKTATTGTAE